jgi:peptidoglycan/LPS O-acetylase OafA/YrhL
MTAAPHGSEPLPLHRRGGLAGWLDYAIRARPIPRADARAAASIEHRSGYRPDVDGLRAIAVLSVVLYHAGLPLTSGGFVGVDVFFVISGFVISKSLLADLNRGRFSVAGFYERRVRRIFPALFVTLAGAWIAAFLLLLPSYFTDFSKSLAASAGFVSNLYFWKSSGYFANGANLRPLLHTWSLSVEEQYYIFAPVTFFVIFRFLRRRWLLALLPVAVLSLALSVWATRIGPTANFFLLPMRAWELLVGALLALSPPPPLKRAWARELAALLGLGLIAVAVFAYTEATPFPGLTALPPCLGAGLLIYAGSGEGAVTTRTLALPPFVGVGLISYSLYLVHWPIISFLTYYTLRAPGPGEVLPILAASLVLATLSWRFVEQPFRHRRFDPGRPAILGGAVVMILAVVAVGAAGIYAGGFPGRFPAGVVQSQHDPRGLWREGTCFLGNNPDLTRWNEAACTLTHGGPKALLWGDSYAAHYTPGVAAYAGRIPYSLIQYTAAGCPPVLSYQAYSRPNCQAFNRRALEIIDRDHIRTVVISAKWVDLQRRGLDELKSTLDALAARGVDVYLIGQSPIFTTDVDVIAARRGKASDGWSVSFDPELNRRLQAMAAPGRFVDPLARLCQGRTCPYIDRGRLLFGDDGHYSAAGSLEAVASYFPLLR